MSLFRHFTAFSDVFIETGTYHGEGIERANAAGFRRIFSCDINPDCVSSARERFSDIDIQIDNLPSTEALKQWLTQLSVPAVIFLDAHGMPDASGGHFAKATVLGEPGDHPDLESPVLHELRVIREYSPHANVILIDDTQSLGTWEFHNLSESQLAGEVRGMWPTATLSTYANVLCILPAGTPQPRENPAKALLRPVSQRVRSAIRGMFQR